jgi:hypothetical protein
MGDGAYAPEWVQSVTPDEIARERERGWVNFHPEDFCHRCGQRNPGWWVDFEHWKEATHMLGRGSVSIVCPTCFIFLWEKATGQQAHWQLVLDTATQHRVAPRGRWTEPCGGYRGQGIDPCWDCGWNQSAHFTRAPSGVDIGHV